jgi:metal-responsive CopG/Arc/MetJ family transcriptional regulator
MTPHRITMKLNQQQLELLDRTIANGHASDRTNLIRLALKEYAARHLPEAHRAGSKEAAK